MPVFDTTDQISLLAQYLRQHPQAPIVACYCAAWCKTCSGYRTDFEQLAQQWPDHVFVWIDIEEQPELLGDEDIENFPTLLLQQDDRTLFFGVLQPHIQHLQGLLQRGEALPVVSGEAPELRELLLMR